MLCIQSVNKQICVWVCVPCTVYHTPFGTWKDGRKNAKRKNYSDSTQWNTNNDNDNDNQKKRRNNNEKCKQKLMRFIVFQDVSRLYEQCVSRRSAHAQSTLHTHIHTHPPNENGIKRKTPTRGERESASCSDVTTSVSVVGQPKSHKMTIWSRVRNSPHFFHFLLTRGTSPDSRRWKVYIYSNLTRFFEMRMVAGRRRMR